MVDLINTNPRPPPLPAQTPRLRFPEGPEPSLDLSQVPADQRKAVWDRLQRERPAQAALIASDDFQLIRKAFNAQILVEPFHD